MKNCPPRYQLNKQLGFGAFGFVYQAFDEYDRKRVAIKRIEKVGKQLSREYEVLVELQDTVHCVKMIDCFYTRGIRKNMIQNMVFEFLEDDLEKVIIRHREGRRLLPERLVKIYAYQIFKGLEEIHQKNIVHRDLKPENILKNSDDILKLADFGSSKFIEENSHNTPYIVSRYYRAPELLLCMTNYNCKIDMWAAGCIVAELVGLQPFFRGKTEGEQLFAILKCLGGLNQPEVDYFCKQCPFLESHITKIPSYTKHELKLSELYTFFKDSHSACSFFEGIFKYIPTLRFSATEALNHSFFNDVKYDYEILMTKNNKQATFN